MNTVNPQLVGQFGTSLREAFGIALMENVEDFPNMVLLDGDVAGGTGAHHIRTRYPDRFIQCGIAEQNMVGVAAGMASEGLLPVVSTFASFLLRGLEQVRLSVAYPAVNVKLIGSHVGLDVGPDGASAQALEDLASFRCLPNMSVVVPATPGQTALAVRQILELDGPVYMRTGRTPQPVPRFDDNSFELGKAQNVADGSDLTIIACGPLVNHGVEARKLLEKKGLKARVLNMSTIKPIDHRAIELASIETGFLVTLEDHSVTGGLGAAVSESVTSNTPCRVLRIGVDNSPGLSGNPKDLYARFKLDARNVTERIWEEARHGRP